MNTTIKQTQTLADQLRDERETRQDAQWRLSILADAVQFAIAGLGAPDCPPIPDGAMIRGKLSNALDKATR